MSRVKNDTTESEITPLPLPQPEVKWRYFVLYGVLLGVYTFLDPHTADSFHHRNGLVTEFLFWITLGHAGLPVATMLIASVLSSFFSGNWERENRITKFWKITFYSTIVTGFFLFASCYSYFRINNL